MPVNANEQWSRWNRHMENCIKCRSALAAAAAENERQEGQRLRAEAANAVQKGLCDDGKALYPSAGKPL